MRELARMRVGSQSAEFSTSASFHTMTEHFPVLFDIDYPQMQVAQPRQFRKMGMDPMKD